MSVESFTKKYNLKKLVYFESFENIEKAIKREKQLKNWKREWKIELIEKNNIELIEKNNKEWNDLYYDLVKNGC